MSQDPNDTTVECYNCGTEITKGQPHDCPACRDEDIQTRSDDGALHYFSTIKAAMEYSNDPNNGVWKVSWTHVVTGERVRLISRRVGIEPIWVFEPMPIMVPWPEKDLAKQLGIGVETYESPSTYTVIDHSGTTDDPDDRPDSSDADS